MEKIVCAANWYKDFPLVKDDPKMPIGFIRPSNCDRGIVFCGLRHHNCLYQMVAITGKPQHEIGEEIQGFLTTRNRFVGREEGAILWLAQGGTLEYHSDRLFSEDLY
jgi:hypothetical protein